MADWISARKADIIMATCGLFLCIYFVQGEDYLLVFHGYTQPIIRVVTSEGSGVIDVFYPVYVTTTSHILTAEYERHTIELDPSLFTTDGIENKTIVVTVKFNSRISLYGSDYYRSFFTPLPIKELGNKYLISSCKPTTYLSETILVVATLRDGAVVNMTFKSEHAFLHKGRQYRTGDSMVVSLSGYQTFTIKPRSDISGTVITSTNPIAVYVGNRDPMDIERLSYDQLLPVNLLGKEHIVPTFDNGDNEISVISEHDTTMLFNGTDYVLEKNVVKRISVTSENNVYIVTGKPSLVLMCYTNHYPYTSLLVVPPYNAYVRECTLPVLEHPQYRILTRNPVGLVAKGRSYLVIPVTWRGVHNSTFYAGTFNITCFNVINCQSESRFAFIFLEDNLIYGFHCGYNFSSGDGDANIIYAAPSAITAPDPCVTTTAITAIVGTNSSYTGTRAIQPRVSTIPTIEASVSSTGQSDGSTANPGSSTTHQGDQNNDDDNRLTIGLGAGIPLVIIAIIIIIIVVVVLKRRKSRRRRTPGADQPFHETADNVSVENEGVDNSSVSRDSSVRYAEIDPDYEESYCRVQHLSNA